jgi:aromatic-L-amino-acid decarboxylase
MKGLFCEILVVVQNSFAQLELLAPVALIVVCFWFRPVGYAEAELNALNKELLLRVQKSGVAVPSSTVLSGRLPFA